MPRPLCVVVAAVVRTPVPALCAGVRVKPCRFDVELGAVIHTFVRGRRCCLCGLLTVADPEAYHRSGVCYGAARRGGKSHWQSDGRRELDPTTVDIGYTDLLDDL
jgi:hypothetical protein